MNFAILLVSDAHYDTILSLSETKLLNVLSKISIEANFDMSYNYNF